MPLVLTPWQPPPPQPEIAEQTVHLWRFPLDSGESLEALLDEQELQRAERLNLPEKALDFVIARARLRQILGSYLGLAPGTLRFNYGPNGKPALTGQLPDALAFNLAHSGRWGLCAVTRGIEVGVDIEQVDPRLDYEKIAANFFTVNEINWLQTGNLLRRRRRFFRLWTRKEAWLKGKGGGFSDPEQELDAAHLKSCWTSDGHWWLRSFPVARHYLATIAVPRKFSLLQRWDGWRNPV